MLRMYGGTARGWGRVYNGVAVLLIILQLTGEDSNGVAGIGKNKVVGNFWFGVAATESVQMA